MNKESLVSDLNLPPAVLIDPVELSNRLKPLQILCHKLIIPDS